MAALAIWFPLLDGLAANAAYSPHPAITRSVSTGRDTAFVLFTGTQSSAKALSAPMLTTWRKAGDAVEVEYPRKRFDGSTIVADTFDQLRTWGYRKVILSGASLGGMVAADFIDYNRQKGSPLQIIAVLMEDAPTSTEDLVQAGGAKFMSWWHAGPLANLLLTKPFWAAGFNPPPRNQLGAGVDEDQLRRQYEASKTYPLSGWTDELRYMANHRTFSSGEYAGIPLVTLQSENDEVVKPGAAAKWQLIFGSGRLITVASMHIGFVEYPEAWRSAFIKAFQQLGLIPIG